MFLRAELPLRIRTCETRERWGFSMLVNVRSLVVIVIGFAMMVCGSQSVEAQLFRGRILSRFCQVHHRLSSNSESVPTIVCDPCVMQKTAYDPQASCGDCTFYYDSDDQVWRYENVHCSRGCRCPLPTEVVESVRDLVKVDCQKSEIPDASSFQLELEMAPRFFQSVLFRLPAGAADGMSWKYEIDIDTHHKWAIDVFYKPEDIIDACPVIISPNTRVSRFVTAVGNSEFRHGVNSCVVHNYGDLVVRITRVRL
jgi:hypothetical protein